ncbi:DNA primase [Neobacillus niacini]|uniref:toprim domain-containing protein n=1 Tax=Neobacillus driksii TaxID=3035913 RepID=UPI00278A7914|nr:toprim domain-containing protein [Neobacillus niacini]MDQ0976593.1 DNA primase [Neobacillus niacini]
MITIKRNDMEHELPVDVLEELNFYDWNRAKLKTDEMVCCSPFRTDGSPSFSINLTTGLWIDFGSADFYSKGNLVTLLSFLRNETPIEVENYLLEKYGIDLSDVTKLSLNIDFNFETKVDTIISIDEYKQYAYRSPYLAGRGISEKVQRAFKIGFDKKAKAVAFAWHDYKGNIINVKFRSTKTKQFFYYPEGQAIANHFYGMHFIYKLGIEKAFIVESEIDALYLWSHGFPAIALGNSKFNDARKQLLLRSPIKTLVIASDNDQVGREVRDKIVKAVVGYKDLHEIVFPDYAKDVNDLKPEQLKEVCTNTAQVPLTLW